MHNIMETGKELRKVEVQLESSTFKGFFHGWTNSRFDAEDGSEIFSKEAIIECSDGSIKLYGPEKIKFLDPLS